MVHISEDLRNLTDEQVVDRLHDSEYDSPLYKHCFLTLQWRSTNRQAKAAADQAKTSNDLVTITKRLMYATWALAGATVVLLVVTAVAAFK